MSIEIIGECESFRCRAVFKGGSQVYCVDCYASLEDELRRANVKINELENKLGGKECEHSCIGGWRMDGEPFLSTDEYKHCPYCRVSSKTTKWVGE